MRYFLIGYKGSGKSTLGRQMAEKLKMKFIDLDDFMEEKMGKNIPEIYTELGDEKFRLLESESLKEIVTTKNMVLSTGGGTPCYFNNMDLMKMHGEVIYLKIDEDTLLERLKTAVTKNRPIVKNKSESELKEYLVAQKKKNEHFYMQANHVIEGNIVYMEDIIRLLDIKDHL